MIAIVAVVLNVILIGNIFSSADRTVCLHFLAKYNIL
jgi:hypothetical protein